MGVQKGPIALESRALLLWLLAVGLRVWWAIGTDCRREYEE